MNQDEQVNALFEKGVRAVRTGNTEAAERLFTQVVGAAPQHELAWLWLAKVSQDPSTQQAALQQAVQICPQNSWAVQNLAAVRAGEPLTGGVADEVPEDVLDDGPKLHAEGINCPNCGGSVKLRREDSKTVVCQFCDSIVDLTPEQAAVVGKRKPLKPAMPIELGMTGTLVGKTWEVIGWLRFKGFDSEETWYWDEWLLVGEDGEVRWLSYDDEDGWSLATPIPIDESFDADLDDRIPADGKKAKVYEREGARISALNGELTWKATVGEHFRYLEAKAGKVHYSVEWSRYEIEMFRGEELMPKAVAEGFGIALPKRSELAALGGGGTGGIPGISAHFYDDDDDDAFEYGGDLPTGATAMIAGLAFAAAVVCALIGLYGMIGGKELLRDTMNLNGRNWHTTKPVEIVKANAPHRIALRCNKIPTNTWTVVEAEARNAQMAEWAYIGSAQFWDEEGHDADGYWHESDRAADLVFKPTEAGKYIFRFRVEENQGLNNPTVAARIESGVIMTRWWLLAAGVALVIALISAKLIR